MTSHCYKSAHLSDCDLKHTAVSCTQHAETVSDLLPVQLACVTKENELLLGHRVSRALLLLVFHDEKCPLRQASTRQSLQVVLLQDQTCKGFWQEHTLPWRLVWQVPCVPSRCCAPGRYSCTLVCFPALQSINRHTEEEMRYTGVFDAVKRMLADEGFAGFYKGMRVKLLQTVLAAALLMMLKEEIYAATHSMLKPVPLQHPAAVHKSSTG